MIRCSSSSMRVLLRTWSNRDFRAARRRPKRFLNIEHLYVVRQPVPSELNYEFSKCEFTNVVRKQFGKTTGMLAPYAPKHLLEHMSNAQPINMVDFFHLR